MEEAIAKEQSEQEQSNEYKEVWVNDINDLANFKFEKPTFDFQEFAKKSEELKEAFYNLNDYAKQFEDEIKESGNKKNKTKEEKELAELADCSAISEGMQELENLQNELINKAKKIIGSIYNGQLIAGVLTSRKGNFYHYRRRRQMRLSHILDEIYAHKEEVMQKLNPEQMEVLAYIFNFCTDIKVKEKEESYTNGYMEKLNSFRTFPAITLTVPDNRGRGRAYLSNYYIDNVEVNGNGVHFISEGENISVPDFLENHLLETKKDLVIAAKQELISKVEDERKKLETYKEELNNKFAKILVFRKFQEQEKD